MTLVLLLIQVSGIYDVLGHISLLDQAHAGQHALVSFVQILVC